MQAILAHLGARSPAPLPYTDAGITLAALVSVRTACTSTNT